MHQGKGKDGDKSRKAQNTHEAHIGHQLTDGEFAAWDQPWAVGERAGKGKAKQQQGQVAGFNLTLFNVHVPHPAGILRKFTPFLGLLRRRFDHRNAGNRLGQPGIHLAEAPPLFACDRTELVDVPAQGQDKDHDKEQGSREQLDP